MLISIYNKRKEKEMLPANTLLGLACLIANKGPMNVSAIESKMNASEVAQVREVAASKEGLPGNMEALIQKTGRLDSSEQIIAAGPPSDACY
jgi:hypothetical protein